MIALFVNISYEIVSHMILRVFVCLHMWLCDGLLTCPGCGQVASPQINSWNRLQLTCDLYKAQAVESK